MVVVVEVRDRVLRVCFEILRVEVRGWEEADIDIGRGDVDVGVLVVVLFGGRDDGGSGCGGCNDGVVVVDVGELLLVLLGVIMRRELELEFEGLRRRKPIVDCGEE